MARSAARSGLFRVLGHPLAGEDVGESLDVGAADHGLAFLALTAQPVDELGAKDVDLAVQDASLVRHLLLLLGQLADQVLQILIPERPEIRESVHFHPSAVDEPKGEYNPETGPGVKWSLRV